MIGRNGIGKTTLLKVCLGERPADEGRQLVGKLLLNHIDQGRMRLDDCGTVLSEVQRGRRPDQVRRPGNQRSAGTCAAFSSRTTA